MDALDTIIDIFGSLDRKKTPTITHRGTPHLVTSGLPSEDFSQKIIQDIANVYKLPRLKMLLKGKKQKQFLNEAGIQVCSLFIYLDQLELQTGKYSVKTLLYIGMICNLVEDKCQSKAQYMLWVRNTQDEDKDRQRQQAQNLAEMYFICRKHASLGKNRLLEWGRIVNFNEVEAYRLLKDYPFDTFDDQDGKLFKVHIDAIITFRRLQAQDIPHVSFEQAKELVHYHNKAMTVATTIALRKHLDDKPDKKAALDDYIGNRRINPASSSGKPALSDGLNKICATVEDFQDKVNLNDQNQINFLKETVHVELLENAIKILTEIKTKIQ